MRRLARVAFEGLDNVFNRAFTPAWNPLYHLGTLGWFFYWIVIVSGIYLYSVESQDDRFNRVVGRFVVIR